MEVSVTAAKKKEIKKSLDVGKSCWLICVAGKEVRAVGELIRWYNQDMPFDEDTLLGIGEILDRLGKRISRMAIRIEENHYAIENAKSSTGSDSDQQRREAEK